MNSRKISEPFSRLWQIGGFFLFLSDNCRISFSFCCLSYFKNYLVFLLVFQLFLFFNS